MCHDFAFLKLQILPYINHAPAPIVWTLDVDVLITKWIRNSL